MDNETLGIALALVKAIPGTAANAALAARDAAVEAKDQAEQAAVDAAAAAYGDVGLVVNNGKLCVRVERE